MWIYTLLQEFKLFIIMDPFMASWFIVLMTLAVEGLIESIGGYNE